MDVDGFAVRGVEKIYCHARAVSPAVYSVAYVESDSMRRESVLCLIPAEPFALV
jgi:hypothetical protein